MGYPAPTLEDLKNPTQSYIASLELFKNDLPVEKQGTKALSLAIVSRLRSEFCDYKLNKVFSAATQSIPTSEGDASLIFNCLQNQDIDLGQIYVQRYTEQFWNWIGSEITLFLPNSTLSLLRIWLNSRDFTLDTNAWEELLVLPGWNDAQKKEIKNFKIKYEFITKNSSCLAYIKEQESVLARKTPFCVKSQKKLQKQYMSQYRLLLKFTESFFQKIFDTRRQDLDQQSKMMDAVNTSGDSFFQGISSLIQHMSCFMKKQDFSFELGSWEDRFLNNFKNISYKIFAWRVKKMLPKLQTSLKEVVNKLQDTNQELLPLQEVQRNVLQFLDKNSPQYLSFEENKKQFDLRNTQLNEWEIGLSSFEQLSRSLLDCFVKQQEEEPTENQKALIEKNQRELIEEEEKANSSQEKVLLSLSSDSDEEEDFLQDPPDIQPTSTAVLNVPVDSFTEMEAFLKNPNQVNGCLSKNINGILQQLKMHLLKNRQTDLPNELKTLQNKKVHEIHAQLVLATAAQEQIIQSIQDQRWNHVVLGFRSAFIHCHFAVEQMLSLQVLYKSSKVTTTHNLNQLEKEAEITISEFEQKEKFLRNIAMHLWFCYPGDYRSFYSKSDYPKPFAFLEKLFHPYRGSARENLDTKLLTEATQMCFTSYCQTIEFIAKVSSSSNQNLDEFLVKIKEIQQKILAKIHKSKSSSKHLAESPLLQKLKETLGLFDKMKIPDFEEKDLLQRPLSTIKEYLQLMKLSLEIPPRAHMHSLQKFLHLEVLANMDKLFKHLFRMIILLQTGEDNHSHDLLALSQLAENFYGDILTEQDKGILEKINLSITHHYLHKKSSVSLQKKYKKLFDYSDKLAICSEGYSTRIGEEDISYQDLEKQKEVICAELDPALDLFHKLLNPLVSEFEKLNAFEIKGI